MAADCLFPYLKASVEKTIALVGVTHGIANLDTKKGHAKRIAALRAGLPQGIEALPYGRFLFEMVGTENLEDLNTYRTGLLHKKGIADLQPHAYVGGSSSTVSLLKVFRVLHEQHAKNTALLLVALALLTDRLVELDPPPFRPQEIPSKHKIAELPKRREAEEAMLSEAIADDRRWSADEVPGELFATRADVRRSLGRNRDAISDWHEALARKAEPRADLLYALGVASMDLEGDRKEADLAAVEAFSSAIVLEPNMDQAYVARALAYENLGELAAAAADVSAVLPRLPAPAELLAKRGLWYLELGRYAEALADFDATAALGHEPLDVLTGRGVALFGLGDSVGALVALNTAIESDANAVVARLHRSIALMGVGRIVHARADLDWIIAHKPDHWRASAAFSLRAAIRAEAGDHQGAEADITEAIARSSGPPPAEWVILQAEERSKVAPEMTRPKNCS
jgi:tetratricopeptide (TPR) repeat protein